MPSKMPDTALRKAYIAAFAGINVPIFETLVPKDVEIPALRIILSTQTNRQDSTNKCGHLWASTILIDIINEMPQGYSNKAIVENVADEINQAIDIQGDIAIQGFTVYNTQVMDSHDIEIETPTKSINRKLIRYQHILG